ncbi:DNA-binding protein [Candidatus Desantisbacteria bacterium CG07_land_8_20_14_0_80_39_15]|nr:MAG: DNA-binding protein [Candidatus Desantisbacteria bacterium CG07_land_8_20_14_0_80_39_15]
MTNIVKQDIIEKKIFLIRGLNVMLDRNLAELYGVETKYLTRQVRRNIERFPEDFMFQLTREEFLRCQIVTSSWGGRRYLPYAFTEQGVAMLSSVLNSKRAIQVNIGIMRVFVNIRKLVSTNKGILNRLNQLEDKVQSHDKKIRTIFEVIHRPLDTKMLSPGKPFSNKKAIRDIISSCEKYIYWVDKYFSRVGLDWLSESLNTSKVKNIKILMSSEKTDEKFLSLYKDLEKELKSDGVKCELRVIIDNKLKANIHDRWIISENLCYNTPSTDTVARGQYSEVKRTANFPLFDEWWDKSKNI